MAIQRLKQGIIYDGFEHDSRFIDRTIPPLLMTTNEAYQIATQWLGAMDMNVSALEKEYASRLKIEQGFYMAVSDDVKDEILNRPNYARNYSLVSTNKVMLPIWNVLWQGGAEVQILGTTKELIKFNCLDYSLLRRAPLILPGVEEMEKYSSDQTNLPIMHLKTPAMSQTNSPPP